MLNNFLCNSSGVLSEHENIVLAESLVDEEDNFYDLTLKQALDEITQGEEVVFGRYQVDGSRMRLIQFAAWTKTKVIFIDRGMCASDVLLGWFERNPPE